MRNTTCALALGLLALSGCAMTAPSTSSPNAMTGRDASEPSALPSADAATSDGLFERYPETRIQAR
jgi:hypothetical protein